MAKLYPQITLFCLILIDINGVGHKTTQKQIALYSTCHDDH